MKQLVIILFLFSIGYLSGCTDNEMARNYGGTEEITLPQGQKLINVTWKDTDLWYLSRPMTSTDTVQTYTFNEKSTWGKWEGTIIIHEVK